jgi:hypothetical protein
VPETLIILDLPASSSTPCLTGRKHPEPLYTFEFRKLCTLCNQTHPQYSRGKGSFMRDFMGPCSDIPTHIMTINPTPTSFWSHAQTRSGEYDLNETTYGHRSQGIYLSPLSQLLVPGADLWDITFRLMGCDGLGEWKLRVLPEEVHSTLFTVLWLCRTSGDAWASMTLFSTGDVPLGDYLGFIGRSPSLEGNHTYFPFPLWPNLDPKVHTMTQ